MAFIYRRDGKECRHSSELPTVILPAREVAMVDDTLHSQPEAKIPRMQYWDMLIKGACRAMQPAPDGAYVATGGGYGSNDTLVEHLRQTGQISAAMPSVKGDLFRNVPEFEAEKDDVRKQIQTTLMNEQGSAPPEQIEQLLNTFYSDEVNTRIAKEIVMEALRNRQPCIYESASIYPDTITRAQLAKEHGLKTILVAGDCDVVNATREKMKSNVAPHGTVRSFKEFSGRFESELVPLFDEIKLYNTDTAPPELIAEKKGPGQKLEIFNGERYTAFKRKQLLNPKDSRFDALNQQWAEMDKARAQGTGRG